MTNLFILLQIFYISEQNHKINIEETINCLKTVINKKEELNNYIRRVFDTNESFSFQEFMYLHNKKPTHNIIQKL